MSNSIFEDNEWWWRRKKNKRKLNIPENNMYNIHSRRLNNYRTLIKIFSIQLNWGWDFLYTLLILSDCVIIRIRIIHRSQKSIKIIATYILSLSFVHVSIRLHNYLRRQQQTSSPPKKTKRRHSSYTYKFMLDWRRCNRWKTTSFSWLIHYPSYVAIFKRKYPR